MAVASIRRLVHFVETAGDGHKALSVLTRLWMDLPANTDLRPVLLARCNLSLRRRCEYKGRLPVDIVDRIIMLISDHNTSLFPKLGNEIDPLDAIHQSFKDGIHLDWGRQY